MTDLFKELGVPPQKKPKADLFKELGVPPPTPKPKPPSMADRVGDVFTGNLRETRATQELPEITKVGLRAVLGDVPVSKAMAATSAFLSTYDDEEAYKILEANAAHPISRQWDEKGNMIIAYGPDQQKVLLNRPGFSSQDALQLAGTTALYTPAGKITHSAKAVGIAAGATEAAIQAGQKAMGGEFNTVPTILAGLGGMVFKWAGDKLAEKFPRVFSSPAPKPTQDMRQYARDELVRIGFKPSEVTDDMVDKVVLSAKGAVDPKSVPALSGEAEFGIPLTKGGRTLNQKQLSLEDSMRVGAMGEKARNTMLAFDDTVREKVDDAIEKTRVAVGGKESPLSRATAGNVIAEGIKEAEKVAYQKVNDAYADIGTAALNPDGVNKLLNATRKAVLGIDKDRGLEQTKSLLDTIAKIQKQNVAAQKAGVTVRPTDFKQLELLRRRINTALNSAEKSDYGQVAAMRRSFDDWVDDAIVNDLFLGDRGAVGNLKTARGVFREYASLFRDSPSIGRAGIKVEDRIGKLVEKIVAADPTGEEVVNAIFGAQGLTKQGGAKVAERFRAILGTGSDGWRAIREEAFSRLVQTNTLNGKQIVSGQKSLAAFNRAMEQNESLMKTVFSNEEIGTMRRLFAHIQRTTPDIIRSRENPSGTSQKLNAMLRQAVELFGFPNLEMTIMARGVEISSGMTNAGKAASAIRPFSYSASRPIIVGAGEAGVSKVAPAQPGAFENQQRIRGVLPPPSP